MCSCSVQRMRHSKRIRRTRIERFFNLRQKNPKCSTLSGICFIYDVRAHHPKRHPKPPQRHPETTQAPPMSTPRTPLRPAERARFARTCSAWLAVSCFCLPKTSAQSPTHKPPQAPPKTAPTPPMTAPSTTRVHRVARYLAAVTASGVKRPPCVGLLFSLRCT